MAALEQQVESRQVVHVPGTSSAVLLNAPAAFTCCLQELWCSTKESVEIFIGSPPFWSVILLTAIDQPFRFAGAPDDLRCAGSRRGDPIRPPPYGSFGRPGRLAFRNGVRETGTGVGSVVPGNVPPRADQDDQPVRAVGRRLEVLRKRRGWTYREMAERAGVPVATMYRWLQQRRRGWEYYELRRLVETLDEVWNAQWEELWRRAAESGPDRGTPATPATPPTQPTGPAAAPLQLPADTAHFTGRTAELTRLLDLWPADDAVPTTVVVSAVEGMAGVGKTALTVHAAHQLAHRLPDGALFIDLHGFTPEVEPTPPEAALDYLLRGLGVPGAQIPPDLDARAALYRSLLARRRMLVVLDNAADETQVRPLLPGTPGCLVVVTSRRRLTSLDEASLISLDTLPTADAAALFTAVAGLDRCREQNAVVTEIVALCGHLPLAVRVAAARLRSHPAWTPRQLADLLEDQHRRLGELDDRTRSVTAALAVSYHHLSPAQRHAFALLGLHPGVDIDSYALAALADTTAAEAQQLLDDLEQVSLLNQPAYHRYTQHDLVRAQAAKTAADDETEASRHAALCRLCDHYAHAASVAMDVVYPFDADHRPRPPPPSTPTPAFDRPQWAEAWLDTELHNLLTTATHAAGHGRPEHTQHQSATLNRHLRTRARYVDAVILHEHALTAAHATGNPGGELAALNALGDVHYLQGRYPQATGDHRQALDIAHRIGDRSGELNALSGLGHVHYLQGQYAQATDSYRRALEIARRVGHRTGELNALTGLGWVHHLQGRYPAATDSYRAALEIACRIGDRTGELNALTGLGWVHWLLGRYAQATDSHGRALEIARQIGDRTGELNALSGLGNVDRLQGRYAQAGDCYRRVLEIARQIGNRNYQYEALQGLGRAHHATGQHEQALADHHQALDIAGELDHPGDQARAHDGLAHTNQTLGHHDRARRHWLAALEILTGLDTDHTEDPEVTTAILRRHLADLDSQPGESA
jgi:tetratricopeptide (TPR) repeat protein